MRVEERLVVVADDLLFAQSHLGQQLDRHLGDAQVAVELPQTAGAGGLKLAEQLDDLALLAKLDAVAAVGDELPGGAQHIGDEHHGIDEHQGKHRRAVELDRQRHAADRQEADVKQRCLGQRNERDAFRTDQRRHYHAHEDLLGRRCRVEPV